MHFDDLIVMCILCCDCVIVCYKLRGKHIHGMMYMGNVIAWLLHGNCIHGIMYVGKK